MPLLRAFKRRADQIKRGITNSVNGGKVNKSNYSVLQPQVKTPFNSQGPYEDVPPENENIWISSILIGLVTIFCIYVIYNLETMGSSKFYTKEGKIINNHFFDCQEANSTCIFVYPRKKTYPQSLKKNLTNLIPFHEELSMRMELPLDSIVIKNRKGYLLINHQFGTPEMFYAFLAQLSVKEDFHSYEARTWESEILNTPENLILTPMCITDSLGKKSCAKGKHRSQRSSGSQASLADLFFGKEKNKIQGEFRGKNKNIGMFERHKQPEFMPKDQQTFKEMKIGRTASKNKLPYVWRFDEIQCFDPFNQDYKNMKNQDYWNQCGLKNVFKEKQKPKKMKTLLEWFM